MHMSKLDRQALSLARLIKHIKRLPKGYSGMWKGALHDKETYHHHHSSELFHMMCAIAFAPSRKCWKLDAGVQKLDDLTMSQEIENHT